MPQNNTGQDLGKSLSDTISSPVNAVSNAFDKVTSYFKPRPDTSWNDEMVQKANAGFKAQADADRAKAAAVKPAPKAAPKPAPKKPSYKDGTDYVPKTGDAKLHKGEAVLKKKDADKYREAKGKTMAKDSAMKSVAEELGGKSETPKKEIKHIIVRKGKTKDGKHVNVHTHVHTHPEHHPDEEHVTEGNDGLVAHMLENQGEPNPGEAEAEAGQSGIPAGAAPSTGAPAGAPPPAAA